MTVARSGRTILSDLSATLSAFKAIFIDGIRRRYTHRQAYGPAAPDPFGLINIDPAAVEYVLAPQFQSSRSRWGTYIIDGDWDRTQRADELVFAGCYEPEFTEKTRRAVPFESYVLYQSCRAHFERGVAWEETKFYDWLMEPRTRPVARYETAEAVKSRLAALDELYEKMKHDGYKSQAELGTSRLKPDAYDEVLVNIGRDGQFILEDGRHRLTLAKIIGLESIPVRVFVRHPDWQQRRMASLDGTLPEPLDHPDLRGL